MRERSGVHTQFLVVIIGTGITVAIGSGYALQVSETAFYREQMRAHLIVSLSLLVFGSLLYLWVRFNFWIPLQKMDQKVRELATGNPPFGVTGSNEFERLDQSIDTLRYALDTQILHKEEKLEAESRAESAIAESKAKSEFLSVLSHEIRTPMNGVIGFAEILGTSNLPHDQTQ